MSEAVPLSANAIDQGYADQVNRQVSRITAELIALEQLLVAGMVDHRVLVEFRDAVNRVRSTSWHVQTWMETFRGDAPDLTSLLLQERVRIAKQVALQLTSDLVPSSENTESHEIKDLQEAVAGLHWTLIKLRA
jgi:hypothetical protein